MARSLRMIESGIVYHVLNRSNARLPIFKKEYDYQAFEKIMVEAKRKYPMRILTYCLMPNHWHLVLYPTRADNLSQFMAWLSLTHTQRWHAHYKAVGYGHLYQGRFKSFPVQKDEHFLQLCRYVERNALRAGLVKRAEQWPWSSLYRREYGGLEEQNLLSPWPVTIDKNYLTWVNEAQPQEEVEGIRLSVRRGRPYGGERWTKAIAERLGLVSTFRNRGRPIKGS